MSENLNSTTEPLPVSSEVSPRKPRLGWLDALRGFTMLLVVTNHVALKSFGMQIRWSAALQFFLLFRMPLFFFISGFLAYKASRVWNARTLGELTLKKMRVQIIPTVVFFLLFLAMVPTTPFLHNLDEALASSMKAGYWRGREGARIDPAQTLMQKVFSYPQPRMRLSPVPPYLRF